MVDVSTFEDSIDVKLAMLLHLPGQCVGRRSTIRSCDFYYYVAIQLYANYAEGLDFSAFHCTSSKKMAFCHLGSTVISNKCC